MIPWVLKDSNDHSFYLQKAANMLYIARLKMLISNQELKTDNSLAFAELDKAKNLLHDSIRLDLGILIYHILSLHIFLVNIMVVKLFELIFLDNFSYPKCPVFSLPFLLPFLSKWLLFINRKGETCYLKYTLKFSIDICLSWNSQWISLSNPFLSPKINNLELLFGASYIFFFRGATWH